MTTNKTLLDKAFEEKQAAINKNFLQEWQPFDKMYAQVKQAILKHFTRKHYMWQPTHDESIKRTFQFYTFGQLENMLGLPYTSSSSFAALWVTNSGYLWADDTHYFIGFAINTDNEVIAIAHDYEENEIYIKLS